MHSYLFPKSYSPWLVQRLWGSVVETLATCQNCAMVKPSGLTRDPGPFLLGLKCCTYFPFLPNFTLGQIPIEKIQLVGDSGVFLPVGLYPSTEYQEQVLRFGRNGFGNRQELLCPFFDSKKDGCSIWDHRPGVCTSYFCKSDQGKKGLNFWSKIEEYLNHFEFVLAQETLFRLGLSENELAYGQGALSLDTDPEEQKYFVQAAWGKLPMDSFFDKISFYQKTTTTALSISSDEIGKLLDPKFLEMEEIINSQVPQF